MINQTPRSIKTSTDRLSATPAILKQQTPLKEKQKKVKRMFDLSFQTKQT
jgi:hypothetical protein